MGSRLSEVCRGCLHGVSELERIKPFPCLSCTCFGSAFSRHTVAAKGKWCLAAFGLEVLDSVLLGCLVDLVSRPIRRGCGPGVCV